MKINYISNNNATDEFHNSTPEKSQETVSLKSKHLNARLYYLSLSTSFPIIIIRAQNPLKM